MMLWKRLSWQVPDRSHCAIGIGIILLNLSTAVIWFYGNLSTYTDSYFNYKVVDGKHQSGSLWLIASFSIGTRISMFISGLIIRKIGSFTSLCLSSLLFNTSIFLTYFTVQHSFVGMLITLGFLSGFSYGCIEAVSILYAAMWFPENVSVATSIVGSAFAGGPLFLNPIITFFINPNNELPDAYMGNSICFSQEHILDKVPYIFLVLGGISSACHAIGLFVLRYAQCISDTRDKIDKTPKLPEDIMTFELPSSEEPTERDSILPYEFHTASIDISRDVDQDKTKHVLAPDAKQDVPTREMLATSLFYKQTFAIMLTTLGGNIVLNMYKQFGQLYIPDDHFLATVSVLINIVVCIFRVVWGFLVQSAGPQNSFLFLTAMSSITFLFWFFTPMINRWVFLFWTLLIVANQNGTFVIAPLMILRYFGSIHYLNNCGASALCGIAFLCVTPFVVDAVLVSFGQFWLFLLVSCCSCLSLILVVRLPPIYD